MTKTSEKFVSMPERPTDNQIEAALSNLKLPPSEARRVLRRIYQDFIDLRPDQNLPKGLTKKMAQMMEVLQEYTDEHGYSPTQEELAATFGVDRRAITLRLAALKRRGYVHLKRGWRGIVIINRI